MATLLLFASVSARALPRVSAFWCEGEHYTQQQGSVGPDRPPFGSGGECLGSNFGGGAGHFVSYRFRLADGIDDAILLIRYARLADEVAEFAVSLDEADRGAVGFPPTGGWGHRSADEWSWAQRPLGDLPAGRHVLRLTSLKTHNNTNIDGFIIAADGFIPPGTVEALGELPRLDVDRRDPSMRTDPNLTIKDFVPHFEDTYYPPDEPPETARLPFAKAIDLTGDSATLVRGDGSKETVKLGESVDGWQLLAVTETPRAAVIETRFLHTGLLVFLGEHGPALTARLPVGDPGAIVAEPRKYPPGYAEAILQSNADLLGEKVLAQGEPFFETCAGLLPELVAYVPISTEYAARKVVIDPLGRIGPLRPQYGEDRIDPVLFDPTDYIGDLMPTYAKRGLLGGWLPAVHYAFYDAEAKEFWEEIAFTLNGEQDQRYVALLHRRGWRYFTLEPLQEVRPADFYRALFCFVGGWARLAPALRVDLPEPRLRDASLAAIARAITTFVEEHPKYGVGGYAGDQHDGFPPTILWMTNTCLEWGMFDDAKRYLTYYFDCFVTAHGTLDYYGPAVAEYGQMLDLVARYVRYTDDSQWLESQNAKVAPITNHLRSLRAESLEQPEDAITRGLLYGSPEADTRKETEYHFSGTAWAYRGLLELSRLYRDYDRASEADRLAAEAAALRDDLNRAARASLVPGDPPFVPPYPGLDTAFPTMTSDRLASYTNYRYWPELLSAEALGPDLAQAVFEYRRQNGGELMATTRFSGVLDDWPFAHQARALLAADRIDQFLLGLYGHLAIHQMPGTFCSYEGVMIDGADPRTYRADYCVPVQLTVPLLVRWMLVFEERDSDVLWLCKAVPRRWFAPSQHFGVRNAPTRWGPVSFRVRAQEESVEVEIIPPPKAPATILLRVRRPDAAPPSKLRVEGASGEPAATSEAIELSQPTGPVKLHLQYDQSPASKCRWVGQATPPVTVAQRPPRRRR